MSGKKQPSFNTLIISAWTETNDHVDSVVWRFRVRDIRTGSQHVFPDVDGLLRYLIARFDDDMRDVPSEQD